MHRKFSALTMAIALCVAAAAFRVTARAETTPEDAKDYRISVMSSMGGHIGAISKHVRGLVEDHGFLAKHAEALANGAAELQYLFPSGSGVGDSEALPAIWDEPEEVAKAIAEAEQATAAFSKAASAGDEDAIDAAFREVGAACRGCHDRFRKDDD
ncbi:MAG: c-type cytochrome [Woeseiaceae bacterium]